jgi:hypothetical protein
MENYSIPHIRKQLLDSGDASLVHLCRELDDDKLRMVLDIVRDVTREQAAERSAAEELAFTEDLKKEREASQKKIAIEMAFSKSNTPEADRYIRIARAYGASDDDLLFARSEGYGG